MLLFHLLSYYKFLAFFLELKNFFVHFLPFLPSSFVISRIYQFSFPPGTFLYDYLSQKNPHTWCSGRLPVILSTWTYKICFSKKYSLRVFPPSQLGFTIWRPYCACLYTWSFLFYLTGLTEEKVSNWIRLFPASGGPKVLFLLIFFFISSFLSFFFLRISLKFYQLLWWPLDPVSLALQH